MLGYPQGKLSWGGTLLLTFLVAYMDVGKEREQDAEALLQTEK